jgi:hypothetical protein
MKKIYLLFLAIFIAGLSFGQNQFNVGSSVGFNPDKLRGLKSGQSKISLPQKGLISQTQITAAVLGSPSGLSWNDDVKAKLLSTGMFSSVDLFYYPSGVPTLAQIQDYDAILAYSDGPGSSFGASLGDVLAEYIEAGGGVVNAVFHTASIPLGGNFVTSGYELIIPSGQSQGTTESLGTIFDPTHPILEGVNSFNGGSSSYRSSNATVTVGSVVIANWTDGQPLIVVKENVGPKNARRADLNFFPPSNSNEGRYDFWDESTDGALIMANALIWVSKAGNCPRDIVVDNDSASCGAVVDYIVTIPEKGSVLQTSGLPTGSEFPIGTTTNCFRLIDSLNVETTCCFTVTVNDTEAPVAVCASEGEEIGKAAYVISTQGQPWGENTNEQAMDMAFGNGNWDQLYYETLDVNNLLSNNYDFIFMEGGEYIANEMETFVDANISAMETWVANGGNLFLNSAPNEGDGMDWGFWGVKLQYDNNSPNFISTVEATDPLHPIFTGPFTPVITGPYNGNYYAHAIIPEELNVNVLMHNIADTTMHVLSSIEWGTGKVFFGGMTTTNWHSPMPEALNLRANMLHSLGTKTRLEFQLDNTGIVTITPEDIDGGSFDNCGSIDSMEIDRNTFTIDDLGEQDVTLTVTDAAGNSSFCTTTITIVSSDKEEPQVVANPMTVYLDETGNYTFNQQDLEVMAAGTTDNRTPFEELKLVAYPKMFNCAQIGEIIHVRLTVEDEDGNNARKWTTVNVLDTIAPMAVCRNIEVYLDENGQAVITPEQVNDTTSFDACGIESINLDRDTLSCIDLGEASVTLMVTDINGNVGTCTAMVMVYDTLAPISVLVADVELEVEPGVCETAVEYPESLFTDNCGMALELTAGLGPDGIFPLGTTTETWIATDDAGNTAEITFNVIVTTTNAQPTLDTVINVITNEDTSPVTVELTGISYGIDCAEQEVTVSAIADNTDLVTAVTVEYVDGDSIGSVMITLAPDKNGTSDITVTVEDSEGGSFTQSFTLTVNPVNDSPVVVYPIADQVINASYVLKLPISSDLGNLFQDPDGDELSVSVMLDNGDPLPAWAQIVGDTLVLSPMIADTGCIQIVVKAIDPSGMFANNPFKLCVDGYPVSSPRLNESAFDVKMYPNPTNGRVNIEINNTAGITDVAVFSITGKEVLRKNFYNNKIISFSMNDYASGMYLVKMNIEGNQIVKKLVLDKK